MIPQAILDELKEKANIVNILSSYVQLKKRGKNHLGLCPFHSEKTPSFTVSEEKGLYHCFGCGEGGNVFSFVMKIENVDFAEAAQIIGEKCGVHVEKSESDKKNKGIYDKYYSIMEMACKFYESNVDKSNEYIKKRGIANPKAFRLGYALDSWDSLITYLASRGAKETDLEKTGLVLQKQNSSGFYDRFRNRLMFPIIDTRGRVIGFSGRAMGDEEPKYLNSPDSAIFNKGDYLYNLNLAKEEIKKQKFILLVEGNVDVVSVYEAGVKNVAAPLGTSLTANQAKLIKRFTDLAVIAFDSDGAGIAASERAQEVLKDADVRVRVATFVNAKDPDELIKKMGKEAFIEAVKNSKPATEFKIKRIINRYNTNEPEGKTRAAHEVTALLSKEKDKILQGEYLKLASSLLNIGLETLSAEVRGEEKYFGKRSNLRRVTGKPSSKTIEAEKTLIRLVLDWDQALIKIKDELTIDDFFKYKNVMLMLWEKTPKEALNNLDHGEDAKLLRELLLSEEPLEDRETILGDCINSLKTQRVKSQMEDLRTSIVEAEKAGQESRLKELNKEYLGLNEIFRSLVR